MKIEHIEVFNIAGAIRGMRNPLESHHLSDSRWAKIKLENLVHDEVLVDRFLIGEKDMKLAKSLIKAGKDHRKFTRQIFVSFDLTAPEYFWKQYHTYKVGTVENSTSQMHTLGKRQIITDDFELDESFIQHEIINFADYLREINADIILWQETKDASVWKRIVQKIPQSFLYKKTCTLTYENLMSMFHSRDNHKLSEWKWFLQQMRENCPYLLDFVESTKTKE